MGREWIIACTSYRGQRGAGAITHSNEHNDREGVVHGVSAHSPPRQTDHLPSKGLSAAAGWGDGGGWCGEGLSHHPQSPTGAGMCPWSSSELCHWK